MESFYRTHNYLLNHVQSPVRRELMDEINWDDRLIGIKGTRGVGKTTFLLQYAKEHFGPDNRECLYMNLNQFCFTTNRIVDFAYDFHLKGGKVLLLDQVFKYPNWSEELKECYDRFPDLRIVFTGSSVMRLKEDNPDLSDKVQSYNLRGFSFREYLNLMAKTAFRSYTLGELLENHDEIARSIVSQVKPLAYFHDYQHHGFYPFFMEKRNFSENLLKTMNMILEVDVLLIKQIEQSYLPKLKKLFYLLYAEAPGLPPNVSQLSKEIETSRATVMNYMKYMKDGRLINLLYPLGEEFPKKPAKVYMQNSNLLYPMGTMAVDMQTVRETFFYNQLFKDNTLNSTPKAHFLVNDDKCFHIEETAAAKQIAGHYYAVEKIEVGEKNVIPLWLFGFLY